MPQTNSATGGRVAPSDRSRPRPPGKLAPGLRLPREVVSQSQRERLTIALIELVDHQGYPPTSVAELTARSHVSRGAFYEHFTGVRDCFAAAYDMQIARYAARLVSAYNTPGLKSSARARATLDTFARMACTWPPAARVCLADVLTVEHGTIERRDQAEDAARTILYAALGSAAAQAPAAAPLITATMGAVRRLTYDHLRTSRLDSAPASTPEELSEALLAWLLSYKHHGSRALAPQTTARTPAPRNARRNQNQRRAGRSGHSETTARSAALARSEVADSAAADPRSRIMQAVLELSDEKGYTAMTHRDIARTAGVSYSTIYKHFPDKQEAMLAVCRQTNERLTTEMRAAADAAESWPAAVRDGLAAYLHAAAADPSATRVIALQSLSLGHAGLRFLDERAEDLKTLLARGPEPRQAEHAHTTADALAGAILETVHEHALYRRVEQLPELLSWLTYIVLAPYLSAREAASVSAGA